MDKNFLDWKYLGVFLDKDSSDILKSLLQNPVLKNGIMDGGEWKIYCHHMTLAFNDGSKEVQEVFNYYKKHLGEDRELHVIAIGASDKAIAAKIDYKDKITNSIAHVTMVVSSIGRPVDSNQITNWLPLDETFNIHGRIGYFGKDKNIHFN